MWIQQRIFTPRYLERCGKIQPEYKIDAEDLLSPGQQHTIETVLNELNNLLANIKNTQDEQKRFFLASLHESLLRDLRASFENYEPVQVKPRKKWFRQSLYLILKFTGMVFFGSEALEGINAVFSLLPGISLGVFFPIMIVFTIANIILFNGLSLREIMENVGIMHPKENKNLLDIYSDEKFLIKEMRHLIQDDLDNTIYFSVEKAQEACHLLDTLEGTQNFLKAEAERLLEKKKSNKFLSIVKAFFIVIAGVLSFGGGFFSGLSTIAVVGMLGIGMASFAIPFALFVGFAAALTYLFVEKPALNDFLNGWAGYNQKTINLLRGQKSEESNPPEENRRLKKLSTMKEQIRTKRLITSQLEELHLQTGAQKEEIAKQKQLFGEQQTEIAKKETTIKRQEEEMEKFKAKFIEQEEKLHALTQQLKESATIQTTKMSLSKEVTGEHAGHRSQQLSLFSSQNKASAPDISVPSEEENHDLDQEL